MPLDRATDGFSRKARTGIMNSNLVAFDSSLTFVRSRILLLELANPSSFHRGQQNVCWEQGSSACPVLIVDDDSVGCRSLTERGSLLEQELDAKLVLTWITGCRDYAEGLQRANVQSRTSQRRRVGYIE